MHLAPPSVMTEPMTRTPVRLYAAALVLSVLGMFLAGFLGLMFVLGKTGSPLLLIGRETYDLTRYGWPAIPLLLGVIQIAGSIACLTRRHVLLAGASVAATVGFALLAALEGKFLLLGGACFVGLLILSARRDFRD